ncbi:MAG: DUF4058 family protein [candidate division KSB1 bacterium]|nr:DUF4058 family protein [candidate division KSB1 bacterium]MDZ7368703.1 DUF4058 family protein [candidate division KSB1 bacterium]MDZ7406556.1 DUF4058 family protein [candidate division KSB1 bacterium]
MPSPFPGMDPYLEAPHIWEDFHANLATEIQRQLAPGLRPRYIAALIPTVTYDEVIVEKTHREKPDVSVWQVDEQPWGGEAVAIAPAPLVGHVVLEEPIKMYSVEIREAATGLLVTAIEILSPVNKRPNHEAFEDYRRKRRDLLRSSVHLMEIDLLRAGQRPPLVTPLPEAPYFVFLHRGDNRPKVEIWPLRIQEAIPVLPVPLLYPDPDVPLDLGHAIQTIYEVAVYRLRLNYSQPPPKPDLAPEDAAWIEARLQSIKS